MRLFIKNIILFSLIIIAIFCSLLGYKYFVTCKISFKESPEKHILFTGASLPYHGIDENLMQTAVNRSARGESYLFTYLKLKKIIEANPQIDTVFIECSPVEISPNSDGIHFYDVRIRHFVTLYYPLFGKEEWKVYSKHLVSAIPQILQQSFDLSQLQQDEIRRMIGSQADRNDNLRVVDTASVKQKKKSELEGVYGSGGNTVNFEYLRKIIDLCNKKNIKLFGIYYPAYKPQYYFDQEYYHEALKEHFPDLDLLDYSYWEVPDSARYDRNHLNWYGARIFTKELKDRFGIR